MAKDKKRIVSPNPDIPKEPASTYQSRALERGLLVLETLAEKWNAMTVADLHESTELSKSTLVRLLSVLESLQYVVRIDERPAYRLGNRAIRLSAAYTATLDITALTRQTFASLAERSGCTSNLGILEGHQVWQVCAEEPDRPIRYTAARGARDSAYCSGLGKVLLASLPPDRLRLHLPAEPFAQHTSHTITTLNNLLVELDECRSRGYALDDNESSVGVRCLAIPLEIDGNCIAAVSITGPSGEFDEVRRPEQLGALRDAVTKLTSDPDVITALTHLSQTNGPGPSA